MKRKAEEIRQLDITDIKQKITTLEKELYNLRSQSQTSSVEKPHRFKQLQREIAVCKTIIREQELQKSSKK